MHRTKRAARHLAWQDSKNPFAKRRLNRIDSQSQLENGDGAALYRPNTGIPSDYTTQSPDSPTHPWNDTHASTGPAAVSRRRLNEPGDAIGDVPVAHSPTASLKDEPLQAESSSRDKSQESEKTVQVMDSHTSPEYEKSLDAENNKKHGLKGLLHGSTHDKDAKTGKDDNNGKDKKKHHFTPMSQLKATLFNSWINILLIASPVGIALFYAKVDPKVVFVVNFIAIIPLAAMLSYATEEIALRTGEVIGGLLNASFGNAVELIVSIIALAKDQILIVQTSLIGSMLSNLLLVMGMCFFAGGVNRLEQNFNITVAQTAASLLFLAVSSLLIPTAFNSWADTGTTDKTTQDAPLVNGEVEISRGTAILLLLVYACYLFFQLKSHSAIYNAPSAKVEKRDFARQKNKVKSLIPNKMRRRSIETSSKHDSATPSDDTSEEREEPQLSLWVAIGTLAVSTVLVALNAEYLVDSINSITCDGGISKNFVGLILLPIVGNAAEHATAVTVAIKDKMDLAIGVAVGSSMQIALLVLPLVVVLGWILGKNDMTLYFDGFQIAMLFVSVLLVNYLIQDGKSHWLEGVLLMVLYIIIAVAAWFYPTSDKLNQCSE